MAPFSTELRGKSHIPDFVLRMFQGSTKDQRFLWSKTQPSPVDAALWGRASVFHSPAGSPGLTPSPVCQYRHLCPYLTSGESSPLLKNGREVDMTHISTTSLSFPSYHLLPTQTLLSPFKSKFLTFGKKWGYSVYPHQAKLLLLSSVWLTQGRLATGSWSEWENKGKKGGKDGSWWRTSHYPL